VQIADFDDRSFAEACALHWAAIDVGSSDASRVGDEESVVAGVDRRMLERHRGTVGAQMRVRAASDAQ